MINTHILQVINFMLHVINFIVSVKFYMQGFCVYFACKCCNSLGLYCKLVRLTAIESVSQSTAMGLTQSQSSIELLR